MADELIFSIKPEDFGFFYLLWWVFFSPPREKRQDSAGRKASDRLPPPDRLKYCQSVQPGENEQGTIHRTLDALSVMPLEDVAFDPVEFGEALGPGLCSLPLEWPGA